MNTNFCKKETRELIQEIFDDPCVSFFTKDIIKQGLQKDCVDAVKYVELALYALTKVMKDILP
jgi:hypothetical protein